MRPVMIKGKMIMRGKEGMNEDRVEKPATRALTSSGHRTWLEDTVHEMASQIECSSGSFMIKVKWKAPR
ncbi:hypothetical protein [Paenibacillus tengchongensis]|uniref:hypothetical protein n=1 Tax=Paenibacillus tengchongensis TaxID=2608684 RepID=UPI00124D1DEB|nr:hypothetical protein [Paenibacillus tengchongensis]